MPALDTSSTSQDQSFKLSTARTGDVEHRLKALVSGGTLPLAYCWQCAQPGGGGERLLGLMDPTPEVPLPASTPAVAPAPVTSVTDNWPMLPMQESYFTRMLKEPGLLDYVPEVADAPAGWGDEDDLLADDDEVAAAGGAAGEDGELQDEPVAAAGEWDDDLDIDDP